MTVLSADARRTRDSLEKVMIEKRLCYLICQISRKVITFSTDCLSKLGRSIGLLLSLSFCTHPGERKGDLDCQVLSLSPSTLHPFASPSLLESYVGTSWPLLDRATFNPFFYLDYGY